MTDNCKLAYAAGIIDGEGCIQIAKRTREKGTTTYQAIVEVSMVDAVVPEFMHATFGGYVTIHHRNNPKYRNVYMWNLTGMFQIMLFLQNLLPFLKLKKNQAELAINYCQLRLLKKSKSRYSPYTFEELDIIGRLKALHQ